MSTCGRRLTTFAGLLLCISGSGSAQAPALDDVLTRAAVYLRDYVPRLARVVASEDYEQRITSGRAIDLWRLKSEVLLVSYPLGDVDWMWFRDVSEANGKKLPHDADRLMKLFVAPTAEATEQAARVSYEGFRYHIGGATVAATNPLLVMALMQSHYQPRLRFRFGDAERSLGPDVRVVKFEEREEVEGGTRAGKNREKLPALLGPAGRVRGSVWVNTRTGEVVKTEARIGELNAQTSTTTTFALDARLALLVPKEMRTNWRYEEDPRAGRQRDDGRVGQFARGGPVTGVARYSNFRRFEVTADTPVLQVPK